MKITNLFLEENNVPLKTPFVTAKRRTDVMTDYVLTIETDEGVCGYGACAPTPVITGDTVGSIKYAVESFFAPMLIGFDVTEELLPLVQNKLVHNTSPKAAVDIALHDLLSKKKGLPLYRYLGGKAGGVHMKTDLTISIGDKEKMVFDSLDALKRGYKCLKVKLGTTKAGDIERIDAIIDAIPSDIPLRLDANQAWSVADAVEISEHLQKKGANIEFIEQPVVYHDFNGLAEVTKRIPYPTLADESAFSKEDVKRILDMQGASMINIKLMKCGGLYYACEIFEMCRAHNVECVMGSMMEGAVSVSAAAHFCAAKGITKLDLDAPSLCKFIPQKLSTVFEGNDVIVTDEAEGLGIKK